MHPYELLRGTMRLWYARMLTYAPTTPSPRTAPTTTVGVGDPDQVLIIGNGPLHGWGVASHGVSVVGHLGRDLFTRTSRPTRVDLVGDERMTAASAAAWLRGRIDERYDVVVVALGMNDALRLEPVDRWAASLDRLLDDIRAHIDLATPIVLVEPPYIRAYAMARGLLGVVAEHHARRLVGVLHRAAERSSRITVVPAPSSGSKPTARSAPARGTGTGPRSSASGSHPSSTPCAPRDPPARPSPTRARLGGHRARPRVGRRPDR